jgi:membrane-associated phospholipid phosphatase
MNIVFKLLGYFGPYILNVISLILLFIYFKYNILFCYFIGIVINLTINFIVKIIVKNPRPKEDKSLFNTKKNINKKRLWFDKYGFPSGHSQSCAYSLTFISLVFKNVYIFLFYLFITLVTSYQRVQNKNHTLIQVIGGLIFGSIFGIIMFLLCNYVKNKNIRDYFYIQ